MRKKLFVLLLAVVATCLSFTLLSCGKKIVLVDFPEAYTEEVTLGDTYELKVSSVKDTLGNEYRVTAAVADSEGNEVQTIDNAFDIESMRYVITYTAEIGGKDSRNSVLTLQVTDTSKPVIRINKPASGVRGEEYVLPKIVVTDRSGETIVPVVKVYHIDGEGRKTEQTVAGDRFTPLVTGEYEIAVTAVDSSGNDSAKSAFFMVVQPAKAGEVANFDYSETLTQLSDDKNLNVTYTAPQSDRADYRGGYASFTNDLSGWSNICVRPRLTKAEYGGFDYISLWVYLADNEPDKNSDVSISVFNDVNYTKDIKTNKWFRLVYPMSRFLTAYDNLEAGTEKFIPINYKAATSEMMKNITEFRLGDIMSHKDAKFTFDVDHADIVDEQTPIEATITVGNEHAAEIAHTLTVSDAAGRVMEAVSTSGARHIYRLLPGKYFYRIVSQDETAAFLGEKEGVFFIEFRNRIVLPASSDPYMAGDSVAVPEAEVVLSGGGKAVAAAAAKYVVNATGEEIVVDSATFITRASGKLIVTYTYEGALSKQLVVEVARRDADDRFILNPDEAEDTILDTIENANSVKSFVAVEGGTSYFSYQRKGTFTGWANLGLSPRTDLAYLKANYTHVRLKIYYAGTDGAFCTGAFLCDTYLYDGGSGAASKGAKLETNTWHTIDFPVADFISNYNKKPNGSAGSFLGVKFGDAAQGAAYPNITEIRIAAIYGVKDAKLRVAVNAPEIPAGQSESLVTLTVTSTLSELPGYTLTVYNAGGTRIEPVSSGGGGNVYRYSLPGGDYRYVVRCTHEDYHFDSTQTFGVVSAVRIVVGSFEENAVAGDTVTFPTGVVYVDGEATQYQPTVSARYRYSVGSEVIELGAATGYTPDASGILEITYSYEGAVSETIVIQFARNMADFRDGYILDTQSRDIVGDLTVTKAAAKLSYVSAEENTDETYSGGYVLVNGNNAGWTNVNFNGRQTVSREKLAEYDYITIWLYLDYVTPGGRHDLSFYNLNALDSEGVKQNQGVITGEWNKLYLPVAQFAALYDDFYTNPAKQIFLPFNFTTKWLLNVRIGEMQLHKNTDAPAVSVAENKVGVTVTNNDDVDFEIRAVDENGATIHEFTTDRATTTYEFDYTAQCKKVVVTYKYALSLTASGPVQTYIKVIKELAVPV